MGVGAGFHTGLSELLTSPFICSDSPTGRSSFWVHPDPPQLHALHLSLPSASPPDRLPPAPQRGRPVPLVWGAEGAAELELEGAAPRSFLLVTFPSQGLVTDSGHRALSLWGLRYKSRSSVWWPL